MGTSKKLHSRKHPLFPRLGGSHFQFLPSRPKQGHIYFIFSFAENPLISERSVASFIYLIAFLVRLLWAPFERLQLTTGPKRFVKSQVRLFEAKIYTELIKCLRAMLTSQSRLSNHPDHVGILPVCLKILNPDQYVIRIAEKPRF